MIRDYNLQRCLRQLILLDNYKNTKNNEAKRGRRFLPLIPAAMIPAALAGAGLMGTGVAGASFLGTLLAGAGLVGTGLAGAGLAIPLVLG